MQAMDINPPANFKLSKARMIDSHLQKKDPVNPGLYFFGGIRDVFRTFQWKKVHNSVLRLTSRDSLAYV